MHGPEKVGGEGLWGLDRDQRVPVHQTPASAADGVGQGDAGHRGVRTPPHRADDRGVELDGGGRAGRVVDHDHLGGRGHRGEAGPHRRRPRRTTDDGRVGRRLVGGTVGHHGHDAVSGFCGGGQGPVHDPPVTEQLVLLGPPEAGARARRHHDDPDRAHVGRPGGVERLSIPVGPYLPDPVGDPCH